MPVKFLDYFRWQNLQSVWREWWFWSAIAGLCLALEAGALYYQHVLDYPPCELCIYVRVWLAGIFLICLLALYLRRFKFGALLCALLGLGLSIGLGHETYELLKVEYNFGGGAACRFIANFPTWAPLDKWFPFLFEVRNVCAATPEVIFGISMADALVVVSIVLVVAFALAVLGVGKSTLQRRA